MIRKIFSFVRENIQLCPGETRGRRFGRHGGWHITRILTKFMLAKNQKFMLVKHQKFLSKPKIKIFVKLAQLKHLLNFASLLKQRWGDQICHNYIDFDIYIYIDIDVDINIDIVKGIDIDIDIGIDNDIYICNYIDINIDIDISLKIFYRKTGTC